MTEPIVLDEPSFLKYISDALLQGSRDAIEGMIKALNEQTARQVWTTDEVVALLRDYADAIPATVP